MHLHLQCLQYESFCKDTNWIIPNKNIRPETSKTASFQTLLLCFCSFELFCPLLDKDISIENVYIVLSCPIK